MGTSASNNGPKKNSSLLPSWASSLENTSNDDKSQNGNNDKPIDSNDSQTSDNSNESAITGNWAAAKGALSRYARGTNGSSLRKASQSYVKTLGGSSKATKSAVKGIATGGIFLNFVSNISTNGFVKTLEKFGLSDCIGKSSEEVLAKIADRIAPIGSTNDEAIARDATLETLDFLYEKLLEEGKELDSLESLDEQTMKDSVGEYISTYIYKKWLYEVGLAIEKNELTEKEAVALEKEIKEFVRDETKSALREKNILTLNLSEGDGKKIIENIFELAYSTISK